MTNLHAKIYARRRYHTAGNNPKGARDQLERWRRNTSRVLTPLTFLSGATGLSGFFAMMQYKGNDVPTWLGLGTLFISLAAIVCSAIWVDHRRKSREYDLGGFGRWIITAFGLFYRYGNDPHRFVAWEEFRGVRFNSQKSQIYLETHDKPIVISVRIREKHDCTDFLPFLNLLVERLEKHSHLDSGTLESLIDLRDLHRKRVLFRELNPWAPLYSLAPLVFSSFLLFVMIAAGEIYAYSLGKPSIEIVWFRPCVLVIFCLSCAYGHLVDRRKCRLRERKINDIYNALTQPFSGEQKCDTESKKLQFEAAPRIITSQARKRLLFTWGTVMGWCFILFWGFLFFITSQEENARIADYVCLSTFAFLGFVVILYEWELGRKAIALLTNGYTATGRIRKCTPNRITVELSPEYGGCFTVMREAVLRNLQVGDPVTVFIDPQNPKRKIIYELTPTAVMYCQDTNSFDTNSRLPQLHWLFVMMFSVLVAYFVGLLKILN